MNADDVPVIDAEWHDAYIAMRAAEIRYEKARAHYHCVNDRKIREAAERRLGRQIDGTGASS